MSMLTCFALRWQRRAPGPKIWLFALKSCQLGLSAARDASVLAAILRRASLTASALAAPAAQHRSWLRQWPELRVHCVWALCPVLLRIRVRVCVVALLDRSWPRQWLRIRPGCASGPASVLAAPVAPAVKRRSFTASPPAVKRCKVCCKTLQLQFYSRAASPPSCKTLQKLAAAVLQPSCVPTSCKTAFYSRAASPPSCKTLQKLAAAVLQPSCVPTKL